MTLGSSQAAEEAVDFETPETSPQAQTHAQRAKSVPSAFPAALPLPPSGEPDCDSPSRPELVRAWLLVRVTAVREREINLIHGPPASLAAMHARHQQAAAHWQSGLIRGLRTGWGWLHTAIYAQLLALADATFSPAGALLAVLFLLALIYWL